VYSPDYPGGIFRSWYLKARKKSYHKYPNGTTIIKAKSYA
jgi:hypothetical protein